MTPDKPYLYGGIFLFLLSVVLLISAVAVPRFAVANANVTDGTSGRTVDVDLLFGAFSVCTDVRIAGVGSQSQCGAIDGSCHVGDLPSTNNAPLPYCTTFNGFRAMVVIAIVLGGLALLSALAHTCQTSPHPYVAHFTFITGLFAVVAAGIALVCWFSFFNALIADTANSASAPGLPGGIKLSQGASFGLLISALVFSIVAIAVWLYGRKGQKGGETGAMAAAPHYHAAPAHYVGQNQLKQPLNQQ